MPEELPVEIPIAQIQSQPQNISLSQSLRRHLALPSGRLERPQVSLMSKNPKWRDDARVVVIGVRDGIITKDGSGFQNFKNLQEAREVFPDLDIYKNSKSFTSAMGNPEKDAMRFESLRAYDLYSGQE